MDCSNSPEHLAAKKRKPSYLIRKEEEQTLRGELLQLEAQVAVLKTQGMPAGSSLDADPELQQAKAKAKALTSTLESAVLAPVVHANLPGEGMERAQSGAAHHSGGEAPERVRLRDGTQQPRLKRRAKTRTRFSSPTTATFAPWGVPWSASQA
ncbi:hypothetical protein PHYPSEUDO_000831 [Phytophthora pseudosyringae]|uniref:Uncharacterized protein n=1 Tax=Phytophthora pseudosyringae TaxID=221518 RepID=A0A8T1WKF0_9STRA|nr:hypothetical protein PHYPSEUDO_000831 [Phytophthora pseudosyringae]